VVNRVLRLGLLSKVAERVTFVMFPPLFLVFLVLGTIFIGVATPTEGGAMGATGALLLALIRRRMNLGLLRQAMESTARLTCFALFILVGSTVFSLTFRAVNGDLWVEHLLSSLPGGQLGFLIFASLFIFIAAFFLDFFELAFIVVPLLGPAAEKMGIDLVWFGILLAVNMQTSFMHPPFGLALFYLRSVAASEDYRDPVTRQLIPKVTTGQIYWGSIPFIIIQLAMVVVVMSFPGLVLHYKEGASKVDPSKIRIEVQGGGSSGNPYGNQQYPGADPGAGSPATQPQAPQGSPTPGNPYETTPPHAPAAPQ
jgi:tripartite ATP-independent transporter DctM subunit